MFAPIQRTLLFIKKHFKHALPSMNIDNSNTHNISVIAKATDK